MNFNRRQLLLMGSYLIGLAGIMLQACTEVKTADRDKLCGNWESVEGKPDVLIYRESEAYKVTVFKRKGTRRLKPVTYLCRKKTATSLSIRASASTSPTMRRRTC